MSIAAVIITKNEQERIRRCLDSLKGWVDEIVVVDNMSTDDTIRIAVDEYGARIVHCEEAGAFDRQRNLGLSAASSDWVLQLDADEVVPPRTAEKIREAIAGADPFDAFQILRRDCVFDVPLTYRGSCAQTRLVRKGRGVNRGIIHEELIVEGAVGTIDAEILHYNLPSIRSVIDKNNFYTELECDLYFRDHDRVQWREVRRRILYKTVSLFFKHYVKNKAYKDGVYGFIRAVLNTLHPLIFWLKILERAVKEGRLDIR